MKKYFLVLVILFIAFNNATAQPSNNPFLEAFFKKWENSKKYTLEVAKLMPADRYDFKPTAEEMTFSEQLLHMAGNINWLSSSYLGGKHKKLYPDDLKNKSKEETIRIISEAYDSAANAIKEFKSEQLIDTVRFFAGPMNKLQVINLLNDHQTHHRGQAIVYLRLNGIKPPAYSGW